MSVLINGQRFLDAFANVYFDRLSDDRKKKNLMKAYFSDPPVWTEYMLRKNNGFLKEVMERLRPKNERLEYVKEKRSIDAMFVGGEDLFRNNLEYPSKLHVLIEHENLGNIEEEMWNLIFFRAPLKVLIFYDWDENRNKKQKIWVKDKLKTLKKMLETVNGFYPECEQTEYLFIIGNTNNGNPDKDVIKWRWASNKQPRLTYLQESGLHPKR